jgi:hypothetical protein
MQIEARAKHWLLRELMEVLSSKLLESGYLEGPGLQLMDEGNLMNYMKDDRIICLHLEEESEESILIVDSESEIPEVYDVWDSALIEFGKKVKMQLITFAKNQKKVKQGIV